MRNKPIRNIAIIVLYDSDKKILLQHRSKDAKLPNYWAFFGGGIENNESPEQAVKREAVEELGYHLENPKLIMTQEFQSVYHNGTKYVFMEKYNPKKQLNLGEGQGMEWYNLSETKDLKIIKHDQAVLEYIKDKY
jgi:mutator protein MutT